MLPESSFTSMAAWHKSNEEKTMSLKAELDAFRSEFMAQVPPEIREAMVHAIWNWPLPESRKGR